MPTTHLLDAFIDAIASAVAERLQPALEALKPAPAQQSVAIRPRLLTVAQAATYLGRTEAAVRCLGSSGAIPQVRADNRVQFDIRDLDHWIEQNKQA